MFKKLQKRLKLLIFEFIHHHMALLVVSKHRSSHPEVFYKKVFLEISQNSQENTFIKKETLAQVFSCYFCEISKNNFFYRTSLVAASEGRQENWNFIAI